MPDRFLQPLQRTLRGRNAILNAFELWIALAGIIAGILLAYTPGSIDGNALAKIIGRNEAIGYTTAYAIAGLMIWVGLLKPTPRWEIAGLWILGAGAAANGIAIVSVFGIRGGFAALTLFALTIAAWIRALVVTSAALRLSREFEHDVG